MYMTITDPNPVPVTYSDQELKSLIDNYLSDIKGEFSYKGVCHYVVNEAKRNNKAEGAPNTKYSSSDISIADGIRVSRILWEKIWNKEIFIAFGDNPYRAQYKDDTRFFINM